MEVAYHRVSPRPAATRKAERLRARPSIVVPFFFLLLAVPPEITFKISDIVLNPARLFLLVMFPIALMRLARDPTFSPHMFDYAVAFSNIWICVASIVNHGLFQGLVSGGSLVLVGFGSYLVARAYIRSLDQFRQAMNVFLLTVLAAGAFALIEVVTGVFVVHEVASAVMGSKLPTYVEVSYAPRNLRMGLVRPFSFFDHPIHYGVFCATAIGVVYFMYRGLSQWVWLALVCFAVVLSLSSGAYMGMMVAFLICAWERVTRGIPHRAVLSASIGAFLYVTASMMSNRSLVEVLISYTLDPASGYYRMFIWDYGTASVQAHPWFGINLEDWQRAGFMSFSIDNFWLLIAMQSGLPMVVGLGLGLVLLLIGVHRANVGLRIPGLHAAKFAWTTALVVMCVQAATVHVWGQLYMFFFFLAGAGAWMADKQRWAAAPGMHPVDAKTNSYQRARRSALGKTYARQQ